jgi:hypothetical protein
MTLQAHGLEHVVQQSTGLANERLTLQVFVFARGFAHDHPIHRWCLAGGRLGRAGAKYGVTSLLAQGARLATSHRLLQRRPAQVGDRAQGMA